MTDPLRIGVIGAARITPTSLVAPTRATGDRLVAVAARSPERAAAFAAEHGIEAVHGSYEELLADPQVEVVYNPLANGLHAPWNLRAIGAGKHVLSEKPSAANAAQAREVRAAVRETGLVFLEAFHYPYHPLFERVGSLIESGAIGEVRHIDAPLLMPDPGADDPRWVFGLAGGATMDLGCYSISCLALLGQRVCGGSLSVSSAVAKVRDGHPGVDEHLFLDGVFPSGATGSGGSDMSADGWAFTLIVTGSEGEMIVPNFVLPHQDDRLILRHTPSEPRAHRQPSELADLMGERDDDVVEHLGSRSSYTYQLEALGRAVRDGDCLVTDADFAVANMERIDAAYRAAGLEPRPAVH
jgi:predicted dehydrogenase